VACLFRDDRVVSHDLETGEQKEIEVKEPLNCAASQHIIAVTTLYDGLHLFSTDGTLAHIVPDSTGARCVAFHSHNPNILAVGFKDGSVRIWDVSTQSILSAFNAHPTCISNIRFAPDCRLFLSSVDKTASIVALDDQFHIVSSIELKGHTRWVTDIIPLRSSNQCVTCSEDETIKVWDCETGVCLRTLTEHTHYVVSLAMHPSGQYFASGSNDESVIIWSSETFEVLRRIFFPRWVHSIVFGESDTLYAGVYYQGVTSCNALTGEVGHVIIPATGRTAYISIRM
jgi:WD40 repeat protein